MIDFGNLLDEFYQESSKQKKSDKKDKYDDKYDLDNGPDTEIEPVDVDVDDDFDNDTTDNDEEKDDKKEDKKKGDKKKSSDKDENDKDNDGEIEDVEEFSIQESYTMKDISKYGAKEYCDMHYDPSQHDEIIKRTIAGCEAFFKKYFGFDVTDIESKLKGLKFRSNNGEEYKISDTYDPEKIIGVLSAIAIHHMWKESEIEDAKGFDEESIINSIECEDLDVIIGKAKRNLIPYHLFINWKGGEDDNLYIYISKNPAEPSSHCDDINVKDLLRSKDDDEVDFKDEGFVDGVAEIIKTPITDIKQGIERQKQHNERMKEDRELNRAQREDDLRVRQDNIKSAFAKGKTNQKPNGTKPPIQDHSEGKIQNIKEFTQEASIIKKRHQNQDVDTDNEAQRNENDYYTQIARNSKDLEHLYKTLLKRADKETVVGELVNLFTELKEMREKYFKNRTDIEGSKDAHQSYHGMQKIIEKDIEEIQKHLDKLQDPKEPKLSKTLVKKIIKLMNNLQQDMITECQRSQPFVVRHFRDIAKKMWLFENYTEDDFDDEIVQESAEDDMFAKIGSMMVHYRKQKELQDLAEKNGVQINGVRYTDDSIMNIVTSVVALMMARNEGDPRYRQLVEQGMKKRSLKVEIINSYKDKANEMIGQYNHGPIVGAEPAGGTIEIISDEEIPVEEFYVDENGEMKSTYYQEADEDEEDEKNVDDDDDDTDDEDDLDESDSEEEDAKDEDDSENDDKEDDEDSNDDDADDDEEEIEEFYIDENGEMRSSWYTESDVDETIKPNTNDEEESEKSWTFRPGKKIGKIEFGMGKKHIHLLLNHLYGDPTPQSNAKDFASAETYGNKFSVYYDASEKVEAVEITNGIIVDMDRSIIFPGDITNIKKKALDLQPDKNNPERGLTSKAMSVSVIVDPTNKIKSILFTRKEFFKEKEFKKFDKVSEMMSNDIDETSAIRKMKEIYKFLDKYHLISQKGKIAMKHVEKDTVLTSNELTDRGCEFMTKYYDKVRGSDYQSIRHELEEKYKQFLIISHA